MRGTLIFLTVYLSSIHINQYGASYMMCVPAMAGVHMDDTLIYLSKYIPDDLSPYDCIKWCVSRHFVHVRAFTPRTSFTHTPTHLDTCIFLACVRTYTRASAHTQTHTHTHTHTHTPTQNQTHKITHTRVHAQENLKDAAIIVAVGLGAIIFLW